VRRFCGGSNSTSHKGVMESHDAIADSELCDIASDGGDNA
jgi:hypothetical protein